MKSLLLLLGVATASAELFVGLAPCGDGACLPRGASRRTGRVFSVEATAEEARSLSLTFDLRLEPVREYTVRSEGGAALFESALDALDGAFDGQYTPPAATGNVSVFVFDSGISGQLRVALPSFCELDRASCASATPAWADQNGHGTWCAGAVAAPLWGVYPQAKLHSVRVLNASGVGSSLTILAGLEDVIVAIQNNEVRLPAVATMSFNEPLYGGTLVDLLLQELMSLGVVAVVAAGNSAADACRYAPSAAGGAVVVVAAADVRGSVPRAAAFSNSGPCVTLYAPGVDVPSLSLDGGLSVMSGTSMAAPYVAGAAALFSARYPDLSAAALSRLFTVGGSVVDAPPNTSAVFLSLSASDALARSGAPLEALVPSPRGAFRTFSGNGVAGFANGPPLQAQFAQPSAVAACPDGILFVADEGNGAVRRLDATGAATTLLVAHEPVVSVACSPKGTLFPMHFRELFVLTPTRLMLADGTVLATFQAAAEVAVSLGGEVAVVDTAACTVTSHPGGAVLFASSCDDPPVSAAYGAAGLYVATQSSVLLNGALVLGDAASCNSTDPQSLCPQGARSLRLAALPDGSVLLAFSGRLSAPLRRISADSSTVTILEPLFFDATEDYNAYYEPYYGFLDGDQPVFNGPSGCAVGPDGTLYVADRGNNMIRAAALGALGVAFEPSGGQEPPPSEPPNPLSPAPPPEPPSPPTPEPPAVVFHHQDGSSQRNGNKTVSSKQANADVAMWVVVLSAVFGSLAALGIVLCALQRRRRRGGEYIRQQARS